MSATEVLVIILATALAVLLVLSIILIVLLIRVTKQIEQVTHMAQSAANNIEHITMNIGKYAAPASLAKLALRYVKSLTGKGK